MLCYSLVSFHPCSIGDRRDAVVSRRQKVKELSSERAAKLQASLAWQQFNRDADEVSGYACLPEGTASRYKGHMLPWHHELWRHALARANIVRAFSLPNWQVVFKFSISTPSKVQNLPCKLLCM